jgi:signal transduction histidine kinase
MQGELQHRTVTETWRVKRSWQRGALLLLFVTTSVLGALGVYTLHSAPALSVESGVWLAMTDSGVRALDDLELDPTISLPLPEFAHVEAESRWWRVQEQLFALVRARPSVSVTFVDAGGRLHTAPARIGSLPFFDIVRRTWLIYFTVVVYLGSALSVFRRHRSPAGAILTFFLLACALYFTSAAPVVARSLVLPPLLFKLFISTLYTAAASLTTLVHFALVFPAPKQIVLQYRWIAALPYATSLIVITLYLSGMIAFGATFPVLITGVLIVIGAFLHSFLQERDPFLRRQIRLSLTVPVLVSLFFICFYVAPGVLRLSPIDFRYVALFFLILPFALPLAMDNLALYEARLTAEQAAFQEKEQIRTDLHDLILNNLAVISRSSEVTRRQRIREPVALEKRLQAIQELATRTSRQVREFLWVLDERHGDWEAFSNQLRKWGNELVEDTDCEFEFTVAPEMLVLSPPALRVRACLDRVLKEALLNAVTHARASRILVTLSCQNETVSCTVQDDGIGFDPEQEPDGHYGLRNMKRRVQELGGSVTLVSTPTTGSRIAVSLPLR